MNGIHVRRDLADLVLEALEITRSRRLAWHETHAFILDVLAIERPDIPASHAQALVARAWRRLAQVPAGSGD